MAPSTGVVDLKGLDDVQVLGSWNFTLQADTPLYWLRCGRLDKYLMKFNVHSPCPSTCGIVLHAEADFGGTDGSSFWIERRTGDDGQRTKRYLLSGDGLDSRPIVTRQFPDAGDQPEEIEVLMQGYFGVIMVQNRKVHLKFRCKRNKGSIAFYNTTQGDKDDVHFSEVRITALRRGPMEIGGFLGQRERQMLGRDREDPSATVQDEDNVGLRSEDAGNPGSRLTTTSRPTPSHRQASSTLLSPSSTGKRFRTPGSQHQSSDVLQRSASDVVLKSGSMKSTRFASTGKTGKTSHTRWIPLAKNAPASEKQLIRDSMPKLPASKESCQDFIAMPL